MPAPPYAAKASPPAASPGKGNEILRNNVPRQLSSGAYAGIVEGDIPVEGGMFTCANCHMRSGLGAVEGDLSSDERKSSSSLTRADRNLLNIREHLPAYVKASDIRPAYTDKTLGEVLQTGIDSGGRTIDPIMPRYLIAGRDWKSLSII
jgi:hypothetical protein